MAVTDISNATENMALREVLNTMRTDIANIRASIPGILVASVAFDPGDLADGAGETKAITVTGAALGDFVLCSTSAEVQDMTLTGYVQAADTVEVRLQNESGAARNTIDLGTLRVMVIAKTAVALATLKVTE